jgi:ribosomal protein S18 acetylase RimI-like enzyme
MPDLAIVSLTEADLASIVEIHVAAFPASLSTALGRETVRRYYEWLFCGPHDLVAVGGRLTDELIGFCFSGVFRGATSGFVRRNGVFLCAQVLIHPGLIARSRFRALLPTTVRILNSALKPSPAAAASEAPATDSFGILAIAVHPRWQHLGAGKRMMAQSESIARARGFSQMDLTVHPENEQALRFYERLGWERIVRDGVWGGGMRKPLAP